MAGTTVAAPRRATGATFVVLAVGVGAFAMLQALLFPVLTTLQTELHTTRDAATWIFSAYLLSAAVFTPILGRLGDVVGKRTVFVLTLLALAAGSLLGALAPSVGVMIVARAIQGVAGGAMPLAFGIIRETYPSEGVTGAVGRLASLTAVAGGVAVLLAGPIVDHLGFRWLFWLPLITTLGCAVAARLVIPASAPAPAGGRIDVLPPVLLSASLVTLLLGLMQAPRWGWASPGVVGLFVGAVVTGALWVVSELRARTPLIDLHLLRQRPMWTTNVVGFTIGVSLFAGSAFIPVFVQTPSSAGYGFSASISESGLILLPNAIAAFAAGLFVGRWAAVVGTKRIMIVGCLFGAAAMAMFAFRHSTLVEVYIASGLLGGGIGLAFSSMSSIVVHAAPAHQTGVAGGVNANIRTIGGAVGTAAMATVLAASETADGVPTESGYTIGFAVLGAGLVVGAAVALLVPRPARDEPTLAIGYPGGTVTTADESATTGDR